jgi:hypothetical protein
MRRALLPLLIVAAILVAAALAWFTLTRGGGAALATEVRSVEPFHRIDVSGHADVTLVQGADQSATVEASARGQPSVRAKVEDGTLIIVAGDRRRWWHSLLGGKDVTTPRITVAFKTLDTITLAGAVKLTAARIDAPQLRVTASGGSAVRIDDLRARSLRIAGSGALKATLAGSVIEQNIAISGAGDVRADGLVSEDATVSVSGAGSIVINAQRTLRANISGAGSVEYYGNPEVTQRISGIGRVKRRQAAEHDRVRLAVRPTFMAL